MSRTHLTAQADWIETSAKVNSATYHHTRFSDIDVNVPMDHSFFLVSFSYEVAGKRYSGNFEQFEPVDLGSDLTILYNPARPAENSVALYPRSMKFQLLKWIAGAAIAAILIYLGYRFGWQE